MFEPYSCSPPPKARGPALCPLSTPKLPPVTATSPTSVLHIHPQHCGAPHRVLGFPPTCPTDAQQRHCTVLSLHTICCGWRQPSAAAFSPILAGFSPAQRSLSPSFTLSVQRSHWVTSLAFCPHTAPAPALLLLLLAQCWWHFWCQRSHPSPLLVGCSPLIPV